jgi:hypothetical protein
MIPNKVYDVLKWVGLIAFPGMAWFVGQVGPVWGMPRVDAVVTTLNCAGTLLGILIGVSTLNYNKKV